MATTLEAKGGWLAARAWGRRRDELWPCASWAHTSPVYLRQLAERTGCAPPDTVLERIDTAMDWLAKQARFEAPSQRERMLQLFARSASAALLDR